MSERYPKRLIEVDLPIARISAHARREKSIRHGHISTLHIWWARRPLAACRAVICAALWPDPADELCPQEFRQAAVEQIMAFAKRVFPDRITAEGKLLSSEKHCSPESRARWESIAAGTLTLDSNVTADMSVLRMSLLDFIADFANWDNSTVPAYLETSRALTQAAHEALGGVPGTRPLVVDPFAGGGSIPLEALRVGADAFASDLNPVAVLLNKVVLEYIPKYGQRLADEVRKWGQWVKEQAEQELAEFYPKDPDGATPIAYLWARTILSEAPGQGDVPVEIPLMRSMWLCKKPNRKFAFRWIRNGSGVVQTETLDVGFSDGNTRRVRRPMIEIFEPLKDAEVESPTIQRGTATCPVTEFTHEPALIRKQLSARRGGATDARMMAIFARHPQTPRTQYRLPEQRDVDIAVDAAKYLSSTGRREFIPDEAIDLNEIRRVSVPLYGMTTWGDLFTGRQLLTLSTLCRLLAHAEPDDGIRESETDAGLEVATKVCLGIIIDRCADKLAAQVVWHNSREFVDHVFARQAIPIVWEFAEASFLSDVGWDGATDWVCRVIEKTASAELPYGQVVRASADSHPLPDDSAEAIITDPPYYYSVPYSHLSDFFYVWLRRSIGTLLPELFSTDVTPKADECVQNLPHSKYAHSQKDRDFYEASLRRAFADSRRVARPDAISTVVFAHSDTAAWESLVASLIESGWCVTASWPIDTEMTTRLLAKRQSTLSSSVHLVCRPRENSDGSLRELVGEWRDVLSQLPQRIHEWMPRLAAEGVVGADAIFACLGPALEIFSRYSRVEKASGEAVPLREYLEQVWAAVSTEALSMIFKDADAAGLEPDARLTAMWLWTLGANTGDSNGKGKSSDDQVTASTGYTLEFDAARKIAQGLGIHLEQSESIIEVKGDKARMLPVSERTRHLFGKDEADARTARGRKKKKTEKQRSLFEELDALESEPDVETVAGELKPQAGETVLDRVHQSMILFASGRGEALRRFLVEDGAGNDARFWKLAQSLSALYPKDTDEKRWVDGVLARKKGLGL